VPVAGCPVVIALALNMFFIHHTTVLPTVKRNRRAKDTALRKLTPSRRTDERICLIDVADADETSQGVVMLGGAKRSRSIRPSHAGELSPETRCLGKLRMRGRSGVRRAFPM
jgi:hypothetical protein